MREAPARRLASAIFILEVVAIASSIAFLVATRRPSEDLLSVGTRLVFTLATVAFPVVGILVLSRHARNRIGWILLVIGLAWVVPPEAYADFALSRGLPGAAATVAIASGSWAIPVGLMGTVLLLRFPNGRLLSPRWRFVEWTALFAIATTTFAAMFAPGSLAASGYPELRNPIGIEALRPIIGVLVPVVLLIPATIVASAVSVVLRFRRSSGTERLQLKWLTAAAASVALLYLVAMLASINHTWSPATQPVWVTVLQTIAVLSFTLIPLAIGVAILKHRLYDIDVIINRAVVFGIVAAVIALVYVGVVAGIGAVVGSRLGSGVTLPIVATAIVAAAFQPLVARARRVADRVVYGRRATPYEALAAVAAPGSAAELSGRIARMAVESTAAREAVVWLRAGSQLRPVAWWPESENAPAAVRLGDAGAPLLPGERHVQRLEIDGLLIGAMSARLAPGESLAPADERLLQDLAAHAAVALDRALTAVELPAGEVTLLMTDVEGSTNLWEEDPSSMARALADHDAVIEEAVSSNGGVLVKSRGEGDSTFSAFRDPSEAVAAALALQRALAARSWPTPRPIRVRAAIHTGEAEVRDRDYFGPLPNRCARLRSLAHGEQVLVSDAAGTAAAGSLPDRARLRDLGSHRLKGISTPERVFQLCHPDLRNEFPPIASADRAEQLGATSRQ